MQLEESISLGDSRTERRTGSPSEDDRLRLVHERLDHVAQSLRELNARREAVLQAGQVARARTTARVAIDAANSKLTEIQAELDGLRLAMRNRGTIEQAKGMLMLRLQVDEDKAFEYLRTLSNTTNRKLADVAADVVRTRAGESSFP